MSLEVASSFTSFNVGLAKATIFHKAASNNASIQAANKHEYASQSYDNRVIALLVKVEPIIDPRDIPPMRIPPTFPSMSRKLDIHNMEDGKVEAVAKAVSDALVHSNISRCDWLAIKSIIKLNTVRIMFAIN